MQNLVDQRAKESAVLNALDDAVKEESSSPLKVLF